MKHVFPAITFMGTCYLSILVSTKDCLSPRKISANVACQLLVIDNYAPQFNSPVPYNFYYLPFCNAIGAIELFLCASNIFLSFVSCAIKF